MPNDDASTSSTQISNISLRLPVFWKANVKLWIKQCDQSFLLSKITNDDTKYAALVAHIDSETLNHVSDIILNPPNTGKYEALTSRLISEFADSEHSKIKKLLTDLQLGDDRPSQLLRKMKDLSAGQLTDDFLQNLWLQRLPANIQTVLSVSSERLEKLADLADKVAEIAQPSVYAVSHSSSATFDELSRQISSLAKQVESLMNQRQFRTTSRSFSRPRHRSISTSRRRDSIPDQCAPADGLCFYHRRFGDKARKCESPCNFTASKNAPVLS